MRKRLFFFLALFVAASCIAQTRNPALVSQEKTIQARPLPLSSVRLTGGPLKHAQDLDAKYLLELEPDRMLAYLRERAGLAPKARPYGGWDGGGRQLTGHIAGHYLSGVSLMYAATGDARFKERADYIVAQLKEIQEKHGDGYIGALLDGQGVSGKQRFQELASGKIRGSNFDLNGLWSPWYVQHKIYAGLRDAYRYAGNATALQVEIEFARWAESILAKLDDAQIQQMLATEFGGMNEIAADLYADTGDARWLALAAKFHHRAVADPLAELKDILSGKHGNTQVPKMLGHLARYVYTGNDADLRAARFFWEQVALHHSFATGGHGKNEYFSLPDRLNNMVDGRTAETCNVYNLLKLTRLLFAVEPAARYADFLERGLFNHILASQDPEDGRACYMVPVGRGVQHEYQNMFESFTCCVGSSMESHAIHADGIYSESPGKLWVNLYAPSIADWAAAGVQVEMKTDFPEGQTASLVVTLKKPQKFTLALRRPYWAGAGFAVKVNGKAQSKLPAPGAYVEIARTWRAGDTLEITLPKTLRVEPLPDNPNRFAVLWGPLVLAGDLGPALARGRQAPGAQSQPPPRPAPVLVGEDQPLEKWLKPVAEKPGVFRTSGYGLDEPVELAPFYRVPRRRYAVYWDKFTPDAWKKKQDELAAAEAEQKAIETATIVSVVTGRAEPERNFNVQSEDSTDFRLEGRSGRRSTKWFSYDLPLSGTSPLALLVNYSNDARQEQTFEIFVDGVKIGERATQRRSPEIDIRFENVRYPLPPELLAGKQKITVRFQAPPGGEIPGVFGLRLIRAD